MMPLVQNLMELDNLIGDLRNFPPGHLASGASGPTLTFASSDAPGQLQLAHGRII